MHDANTQDHHPGRRHPGRPHNRRDEFGFGPGFGPPYGSGRGGRGGRKRMRRGDVRAAILVLLAEEPRNGYQLMQEIEERSDGNWRPSSGSVYPALSQLEDEGLVKPERDDSGKHFTLTDEGRQHVEENAERLGEPWKNLGGKAGSGVNAVRDELKPLMAAVGQLMHSGNEADNKQGAEVLAETRRKIYAILAESRTDIES
ncbi:MAG: PadR family transcriptional regulator [Thermoleophilaceae bacterium]|nr:PadR family transcriptional regulator [Thermoleophilaceae bacterium]